MTDTAQKVWLVTGASRGIGAEIAKAVLAAGDKLIATARKVDVLNHLRSNDDVFPVALDVTDESSVKSAVAAALDHFGRIDVLVNNAGYGLLGAIEEASVAEVEANYRTNVFGLLNMIRSVLPAMRSQRSGRILNLSSLGGYQAYPGWGIYGSTKFAVEGISEALHAEVAPFGIKVTVIEPGFFRTDFLDEKSLIKTKSNIEDYHTSVGGTRAAAEEYNHQQPGDPAKLARAIVQIANAPEPPLRLPLGTDALNRIAEKNAFVEKEAATWRELSISTDF